MTRFDLIEERLAKLEAAIDTMPAIRFHGPWRDGVSYPEAAIVQRAGALFISTAPVAAGVMPHGHDPDVDGDVRGCWRLVCQRGRPGKDADNRALELRVRALEQRL